MDNTEQNSDINSLNGNGEPGELKKTIQLSDMYENWFLDYASYVILERAVPDLEDGLKPVQRRLLHSLKELDDGRYNKVANVIGHTMKYHPHGDASIGDALVQIGQKDLLLDTQGNWGNIFTGDSAAAPRYIEVRLSKFALDVVFNPKTTSWKPSYDGRNKEPITLPVKFPLLLAQGSEGIAVGLASKILPHNFNELIDACISDLKGADFELLPDFPTGGLADCSKYNDGLRGGRIKVRAKINMLDKKTLSITELPYGKTTGSLIESIINANDKGKIKIKKIEDNTAEFVEILIHLAPGISPDQTIDALYAFTDCEMSLNPNSCVIDYNKPKFLGVKELLRTSNKNTLDLLELELKIKLNELMEQLFFSSLEKIFIEKRIYRDIEKCETWDSVISTIDKGLTPYKKQFYREISKDDIVRLTEIKIKRISKFDAFKAEDYLKSLEEQIEKTKSLLANLIDYAIGFYEKIKEKYGKLKGRKTEIRNFDVIEATKVAVANEKLYVNRSEGFAGTSLKKDEYVCECSDIDDIIAIREDGTFIVTKVANKVFLGKNIIHIDVFNKNDDRTTYNIVYLDASKGRAMVKRFSIVGVQRDKEYSVVKGNKFSKILYLTVNPNGEAEVITVHLKPKPRLKILVFDFDFSSIEIKGRSAGGNILTKNQIKKLVLKEEGISTLSAIDVWFDEVVKKLNNDGRGTHIGSFSSDDKLITFYKAGYYRITGYDITTHFDDGLITLCKYDEKMVVSTIYFDNEVQAHYLKRFNPESSERKVVFIGEDEKNSLIDLTFFPNSVIHITYPEGKRRKNNEEDVLVDDFIGVKSYKAKGKRLSLYQPESIELIVPVFEDNISQDEIVDADSIEVSEIIENDVLDVKEDVVDDSNYTADELKIESDSKDDSDNADSSPHPEKIKSPKPIKPIKKKENNNLLDLFSDIELD